MRSDRKIRKQVEFYKDDYEWYIRTHQIEIEDTNKTGFGATIALLLHSYREVCESKKIDLKSLTIEAAKIAQEEKEAESRRVGDKETGISFNEK